MSTILDLLPVRVNIHAKRSTTRTVRFAFTDAAGAAVDVSGKTVSIIVKASRNPSASVVYTTTLTNGPAAHQKDLSIPPSETWGDTTQQTAFVYEIRIADLTAAGSLHVWFEGELRIFPVIA